MLTIINIFLMTQFGNWHLPLHFLMAWKCNSHIFKTLPSEPKTELKLICLDYGSDQRLNQSETAKVALQEESHIFIFAKQADLKHRNTSLLSVHWLLGVQNATPQPISYSRKQNRSGPSQPLLQLTNHKLWSQLNKQHKETDLFVDFVNHSLASISTRYI